VVVLCPARLTFPKSILGSVGLNLRVCVPPLGYLVISERGEPMVKLKIGF
jgi:hypothetical protein